MQYPVTIGVRDQVPLHVILVVEIFLALLNTMRNRIGGSTGPKLFWAIAGTAGLFPRA